MNVFKDRRIGKFNFLNDKHVKYFGRYLIKEDGVYFAFTCTGFELVVIPKTRTNSLKITLDSNPLGDNLTQYIVILIDDNLIKKIELSKGIQEIEIAKDLSIRKHLITVLKVNEASVSQLTLLNINVDHYKVFKRTYEKRKPILEVYGDSLSCGYGNLGNPTNKSFCTKEEDGTLAYPYLLSSKLNMELFNIAWSGISFGRILSPYGVAMIDKYKTIDGIIPYRRKKSEIPDLLIINLGSNDHGKYDDPNLDMKSKKKGLVEFRNCHLKVSKELLKLNPHLKIIYCYNMCFCIQEALINEIYKAQRIINSQYSSDTCHVLEFANEQLGANGHISVIGHYAHTIHLYKYINDHNLLAEIKDEKDIY